MFVRQYYQTCNSQRREYRALVESYRTERGPRQRAGAHPGLLPGPRALETLAALCRRAGLGDEPVAC